MREEYNDLLSAVFSEIRTANDIMTRNVVFVRAEDSALQAARTIVDRRISGLPVVTDEMTLVGIITEKDVLRLLVEVDPDSCVEDHMTKDVRSFERSSSVLDICAHLSLHNIKRVPIVDNGKLVGVVSRRDVIKEILRLRGSD